MTALLWMVGVLIGNALDPVLWIGAIAIGLKVRFWVWALLLAVANGFANDLLVRAIAHGYSGQGLGGKVFASVVFTGIVFWVAWWRRRSKTAGPDAQK